LSSQPTADYDEPNAQFADQPVVAELSTHLSASLRRGRKGTATRAVGGARPVPKARRVPIEMVKEMLDQPNMSDESAALVLDEMYSLAGVMVDALDERQWNNQPYQCEEVPAATLQPEVLMSSAVA